MALSDFSRRCSSLSPDDAGDESAGDFLSALSTSAAVRSTCAVWACSCSAVPLRPMAVSYFAFSKSCPTASKGSPSSARSEDCAPSKAKLSASESISELFIDRNLPRKFAFQFRAPFLQSNDFCLPFAPRFAYFRFAEFWPQPENIFARFFRYGFGTQPGRFRVFHLCFQSRNGALHEWQFAQCAKLHVINRHGAPSFLDCFAVRSIHAKQNLCVSSNPLTLRITRSRSQLIPSACSDHPT